MAFPWCSSALWSLLRLLRKWGLPSSMTPPCLLDTTFFPPRLASSQSSEEFISQARRVRGLWVFGQLPTLGTVRRVNCWAAAQNEVTRWMRPDRLLRTSVLQIMVCSFQGKISCSLALTLLGDLSRSLLDHIGLHTTIASFIAIETQELKHSFSCWGPALGQQGIHIALPRQSMSLLQTNS
jgi:hypothetical protein